MILARIDECILDAAQRPADAIHRATGLDSVYQYRIISAIAAVGWLALVLRASLAKSPFDWIGALCFLSELRAAFFEGHEIRWSVGARNPMRASGFAMTFRLLMGAAVTIFTVADLFKMRFDLMGAQGFVIWAGLIWYALDVQRPIPKRQRVSMQGMATEGVQ